MATEIKRSFYDNGKLKAEIPYVNNKKTGRAKLFFISYGGSSLLVSMASIGIILNISRIDDKK